MCVPDHEVLLRRSLPTVLKSFPPTTLAMQIIPPHDAGIAAAILDSLHPSSLAGSSTQGAPLDRAAWQQAVAAVTSHPLVSNPMVKVSEEYWHRLETLRFR
eukprot:364615-Chlamydomonas_euryale.AAC.22